MDDGEIPPTETVRFFIQHPEQPTDLTAFQQALAMDNLLEQAEVNFRTLCDPVSYTHLGITWVQSPRSARNSASNILPPFHLSASRLFTS